MFGNADVPGPKYRQYSRALNSILCLGDFKTTESIIGTKTKNSLLFLRNTLHFNLRFKDTQRTLT